MDYISFISIWVLLLLLHFVAYPLQEDKEYIINLTFRRNNIKIPPVYPIQKFLENLIIPIILAMIAYFIGASK
ncbi:TPA: hypothetical protein ACGOWI_001874 [Streptococcus suis]